MAEDWMIDELAHAGAEHLDEAFAAGYDRKQGYPDPGVDLAVFRAHGLGAGSVLVDLGAGSGQFSLPAAREFGQVIAVDVSPAMVALMTERATADGLANLRVERAGFLSYHHDGPPADGVYIRNALHQLPDFWKGMALTRIAAMLRPGGVLRVNDLIFDFQPSEAEGISRQWFAAADYAEHIRTEFSTYRWLFEPILAAAGFEIVSVDYAGLLRTPPDLDPAGLIRGRVGASVARRPVRG